jgi:hypothetical protein
VAARGSGAAWASLVAGIASVLTMPIAVYATRFSASFGLVEAGYAIPLAVLLGLAAVVLARRARRMMALGLGRTAPRAGVARSGTLLGIVGICIAAAALVALAVYGLLDYAGTHG